MDWLTPELINEIRVTFEPKYGRKMSDSEIVEIAENLTGVFEELLKLIWKEEYERRI